MFRTRHPKKGQGTLEYISLITFVLIAFFIFQKYIARGFAGRWKTTGDSFADGRQYDPSKTIDCAYYEGIILTGVNADNPTRVWYDSDCFEEMCIKDCYSTSKNTERCRECMEGCDPNRYCTDNNPQQPPS